MRGQEIAHQRPASAPGGASDRAQAGRPSLTLTVRRTRRAEVMRGLAVCFGYLALTIGVTWPLAPNFTTALTGVGDTRHHLWMLWHTREALAGRGALFPPAVAFQPPPAT